MATAEEPFSPPVVLFRKASYSLKLEMSPEETVWKSGLAAEQSLAHWAT